MTKDEAIHKALKVLNCLNNDRVYETAWVKGAINACEEALEQPAEPRLVSYALDGSTCTLNIDGEEVYFNREQPAQDYVFICKRCGDDLGIEYVPDEQPAQEPVGVVSWHEGAVMGSIFPSSNMPKDGDKLYTNPHQWQGLTDDEIVDWFEECFGHDDIAETTMWFAKRLLEAVKEKNDIK